MTRVRRIIRFLDGIRLHDNGRVDIHLYGRDNNTIALGCGLST